MYGKTCNGRTYVCMYACVYAAPSKPPAPVTETRYFCGSVHVILKFNFFRPQTRAIWECLQERRYVMMTSVSERRLDDTAPATGVAPSAASSGPTEAERRSQADLFWGDTSLVV